MHAKTAKEVSDPVPQAQHQESPAVIISVRRGLPKSRASKPPKKIIVTDFSRPRPAYIYVATPNLDQREAERARTRRRRVRNLTVSTVSLAVLLVGAGIFYTWYTDKHATAFKPVVSAAAAVPAVNQPITPRLPAKGAQESVAEISFSTPIQRGDTASLYIQTLPLSVCTIAVTYGSVLDKQPALNTATADSFGSVGWNWSPPNDVPAGDWPITITCAYGGKTAVLMEKLSIIG
ncbi:MAG TPA: hypothetical protein VFN56_02165 [Candidatus Saccharimonadales bacterium]|nr:hypothetical protein [Candidatus Saccharimonadales bacterium]